MGIKGLFTVLTKLAPEARTLSSVASMRGKVVGIDASLAIYEWATAGAKYNIVGSDGQPINHLQGLLWRTSMYRAAGAEVVYVFDGKPPAAKEHVLVARRAAAGRDQATGKPRVNFSGVFGECRALLRLLGTPFITAPGEAEAQLAVMAREGVIDYVATEDSDALVFGAPIVVRDAASRKGTVEWRVDIALQRLEMTREQFVDFCVLLGCDYTGTLPGVGPARALTLIRKHGSIEEIFKALKLDPETHPMRFREARELLLNPTVTRGLSRPASMAPDEDNVRAFLAVAGLDPRRVETALARMRPLGSGSRVVGPAHEPSADDAPPVVIPTDAQPDTGNGQPAARKTATPPQTAARTQTTAAKPAGRARTPRAKPAPRQRTTRSRKSRK